jgi:hypothetical protein
MTEETGSDAVEPNMLTERQWDALGRMRRLEHDGLAETADGGGHLAAVKSMEGLGLVEIEDSDRQGHRWAARLTDAGRRAADEAPLTPPFRD